jgi:hypothetical protein
MYSLPLIFFGCFGLVAGHRRGRLRGRGVASTQCYTEQEQG